MNVQINQLVKSLLQKESLEQCSVQELEEFADRHPYFGAAQLLLTKKLQTENSEKYDEQLQKTFLFFHNPLWVEHLLNETGHAEIISAPANHQPSPDITVASTEDLAITPTPAIIKDQETAEETVAIVQEKYPETKQSESVEPAPQKNDEEPAPAAPQFSIPSFKIEPLDPEKSEMLFQPYHTVDYFASQGINIKEEAKPVDKFGKQLKSFTDWLKTMKKLPVADLQGSSTTQAEQQVEKMAELSIAGRDVYTEAMAEVWEKQGNPEKAIGIYHKLSLLDPSKSAYFAAKIEALKK